MPEKVKRPYQSELRSTAAEQTRRQIIDVARELFIEDGYATTSVRQLAEASGVAPQTIYNAFGSKFGLFSAVIDTVVAGDHEPIAVADRPGFATLAEMDDPVAIVEALVAASTEVLGRLSAIYPTLRAAESDPAVADAYRRFALLGRWEDCRRAVEPLARLDALVDGLGADEATDIVWATLSPDAFQLLVVERGWTPERFADHAASALSATLLGRLAPR
ncbi:MAG: TetR/AcrR family transcriptional regulator [Actinomycetota bacterium]|nr:TetR/AcrR family transcriptional regulator [Actinomycetota bacterium]